MTLKRKEYLICVDSDGCAMDTMNDKHMLYFGPVLIRLYGLQNHQKKVQACWNRVNLFSEMRGMNRFLALIQVLKELQQNGIYSGDISNLETWADTTKSLSNDSLKEVWSVTQKADLELALRWSEQVNWEIQTAASSKGPFPGVAEALKEAAEVADIVVVSSANPDALYEEWEPFLQKHYITRIMSQNDGSKKACIGTLIDAGYHPDRILMVGDAPGDLKAAKENQVHFYPILAGKEEVCWCQFLETALKPLTLKTFTNDYQTELEQRFYQSLVSTGGKHETGL